MTLLHLHHLTHVENPGSESYTASVQLASAYHFLAKPH